MRERAAEFPPERAEALTGVPAKDIVDAAHIYADGPSTFVSGHGIDAFSNGVQTFRAFHCLVAISGNVDRLGGNRRVKKPKGFLDNLQLIHDPKFRLPREIEVGRYHSLAATTVPEVLEVTSRTADGEVMGVRHAEYRVEGVQFHPESVLTPLGPRMARNFLS